MKKRQKFGFSKIASRLMLTVLLSFYVSKSYSQILQVVPIGQAKIDLLSFSIDYDQKNKTLKKISQIISNDFLFYKKLFSFKKKYSQANLQIRLSQNKNIISTAVSLNQSTESFDLTLNKLRKLAHDIAGQIYEKVIKKKAIFDSRIIFISDIHSKGTKIVKELFIMDFDGYNKKQLTFFGKTVLSPAFSPDNSKVSFSLIERVGKYKNINLYLLDLKTRKFSQISSFKGINSGAVFSSDGKDLILTLSISGNAEIYKINIATKKLTRITRHYAPDVDPSVHENQLVFLSGRPGKPMIYTANLDGLESQVKRISFVGRFNATPRFSPTGKEIVFSSWLDARFDLFRVNFDGSGLVRLTKDFGSNEDPSYTKDGQFIVFSSQRIISRTKAVTNLVIIDRDGLIIGPLTRKYGNCQSPRLSN